MKIKNIKAIAFVKNLAKAYTEGIYADTPANRKLGRVGMSYKEWISKQSENQNGEKKKFESIEDLPWEQGRTGEYFELNNHSFEHNLHGYFVDEEFVDEKKVLDLANKYSNSKKEYPVKNKKEEDRFRTRKISKELIRNIERDKKAREKTKEITKDLKSLDNFIPKTNGGRKYLRRGDRELEIFVSDKNNPKSITFSNNKGEILYNKNAALDFINNKENFTNNDAMSIYHDTIDNFIESNKGKQLDGKFLFDILKRKGTKQWEIESIEKRGKNLGWDDNKVKKDIIYDLVKIEEENFKDSITNKEDLQNKIENYLNSLDKKKENIKIPSNFKIQRMSGENRGATEKNSKYLWGPDSKNMFNYKGLMEDLSNYLSENPNISLDWNSNVVTHIQGIPIFGSPSNQSYGAKCPRIELTLPKKMSYSDKEKIRNDIFSILNKNSKGGNLRYVENDTIAEENNKVLNGVGFNDRLTYSLFDDSTLKSAGESLTDYFNKKFNGDEKKINEFKEKNNKKENWNNSRYISISDIINKEDNFLQEQGY